MLHQPYTYLIGWSSLNIYYYGARYSLNCSPSDLWVSYFTSSKYVKEYRIIYGEPDVILVRRVFTNVESCRLWEDKVLKRLHARTHKNLLNKAHPGAYGHNQLKLGNIPWNKGLDKRDHRILAIGLNTKTKLTGFVRSKEFKEKISKSTTGKFKNITNGIINKRIKIEKLEEFLLDNPTFRIGVTIGFEHSKKISNSLIGRKKPIRSQEHIDNHKKSYPKSNKNKGIPKSDDHKQKLREYNQTHLWYNNGINQGRFIISEVPDGWIRGKIRKHQLMTYQSEASNT